MARYIMLKNSPVACVDNLAAIYVVWFIVGLEALLGALCTLIVLRLVFVSILMRWASCLYILMKWY